MKKRVLFSIFLSILFSIHLEAQNNFSSEDDLKEKAEELFQEDKFVEATPLFAQLLSLYPKDQAYNYKYGACLLASDPDKEKPLKYLNFAVGKGNADPLAYYYLGRAHHLNYNFAQAVKNYSRFKNKASSDQKVKYEVERKIEMCKNGNDLLSRLNEVQVLDRKVISEKDFFRVYDLEGINGKIISKPEDFMSKEDKKRDEKSIMYLPPDAREVYFSSYGRKGENGRDIFKKIKLGNGNWSEAVNIGQSINTPYDENYPFIHPDGRTLYFASKGHNSMGGYDLFVSTYDESIADWTEPVNLDFAFSSVDNDILFITDEKKVLAYFASNRTNKSGEITVYKVLVEKAPADLSVIKGKFIAEGNPNQKSAKITVIDQATNKTIGVYETDDNGNYQVEIASNGGTYKFNIETTDEAPIHTGVVNIPKQDEFEVLGQELRLVGQGNQQQLVIKNIFDGTTAQNLNKSGPQISSEVLRRKANLDVNMSQSQLASLNESNKKDAIVNEETPSSSESKLENESSIIEDSPTETDSGTALALKEKLRELEGGQKSDYERKRVATDKTFQEAFKLKEEADSLFELVENQRNNGISETDWKATEDNARETALKAAFTTKIAQKLEESAEKEKEVLDYIQNKKQQIDSRIENDELEAAELEINELSTRAGNVNITPEELIANEKREADEEISQITSRINDLEQKKNVLSEEESNIETQLSSLRSALETAPEGKKAEITEKIEALKLDSSDMNYQSKKAKEKYENALAQKEALKLKKAQVNLAELAIKESDKETNEVADSDKKSLIDAVKTFRDNGQLAYISDERRTNLNSNTIVEKSLETSEEDDNTNTDDIEAVSESDPKSLETINESHSARLQSAENLEDRDLKKAEKIAVYDSWITDLESKLVQKEAELTKSANQNERDQLRSEVDQILQQIEEKTRERENLSDQMALEASGQASALSNNTDQETGTDLPSSNANLSNVDESTVVSDDFSTFNFEESFNYNSNSAREELGSAKRSLVEAQDLAQQAESAKQAAYSLPTVEERNKAFEKANSLEEASKQKQVEAAKQYAEVNRQEYFRNSEMLENASNYEDFESSNLDIANLLAEEADVYFNKASELRSDVNSEDRLSKVEVDLQKAYDYEMLALRKQSEALKTLRIVDTEYQNKDAITTTETVNEPFVQPITDAEVLEVTNPENAKQRADSLTAVVQTLRDDANTVRAQAEGLAIGDERDSLMAEYNQLMEEADRKMKKASIFYKREEQINARLENQYAQLPKIGNGILKPASVSTRTVEIDTVNIDDEREDVILNSQAYINYVNRSQERKRLIKEAELEYQNALSVQEKQQQLTKEAIGLRIQAQSSSDEEKADRLIKSATVLEQRATDMQGSIDSINNVLKVKNYLINNAENDMANAISGLNEIEQKEVQQLAMRNVEAAPLALNASDTGTQSNLADSGEGELNSNESSSLNSSETQKLDDDENQLETTETTEPTDINDPLLEDEEVDESKPDQSSDDEIQKSLADDSATKEERNQDDKEINSNLTNKDQEASTASETDISKAEKKNLKPMDLSSSRDLSLTNIDRIPGTVKSAIFLTFEEDESAYGVDKPIPVNETLPEGLIYKVQVGAFRNPIPQNLFKGFAPLMGEKGPNGITRYTAGIFVNEAEAISARNEIRGMGYSDAFVVAFLNGERISISQARNLDVGATTAESNFETTTSPDNNKETLPVKFNQTGIQAVNHVNTIDGVYFTVQIGVYSKPVSNGTFTYENLLVKPLANGLTRYNTGVFRSAVEAEQAKNRIIGDIEDAFVTAYYNGKRISLNEAARIMNQN